MLNPIWRGALVMRSLGGVLAAGAILAGCSGSGVTLTPQHTLPTPTPTIAGSATPTPTPTVAGATPTPTPTPTASPSGTIVLSPNPVVVSAQGSGCSTAASFSVSESGYSGTFTAVSQNTSIVTVAPTNGDPNDFTVTSVTTTNGGLGTTIVVTDANGHHNTENVGIATCLP